MEFLNLFRTKDLLIYMLNYLDYREKLRIRFMYKEIYEIIKNDLYKHFYHVSLKKKMISMGLSEKYLKTLYESIEEGKMVIAGEFPTSILTNCFKSLTIDIYLWNEGILVLQNLCKKWNGYGKMAVRKY